MHPGIVVDEQQRPATGPAGTPRTPGPAGTPRTPGPAGTPRTPGPAGTPRTPGPRAAPDLSAEVRARLEDAVAEGRSLAWAFGYDDVELRTMYREAARLLEGGQVQQARTMMQGLAALDESVPLFHLGHALACRILGDVDAALAALDLAVASSRGVNGGQDLVAAALLQRGRLRADLGDVGGARADLEEAARGPLPPADVTECKALLAHLR